MRILPALLLLLPTLLPAVAQEETAPMPRPRPPQAEAVEQIPAAPRDWPAWIPQTALTAAEPATAGGAAPIPAPRPDPRSEARQPEADPERPAVGEEAVAPAVPSVPPEPRIYQTACPAMLLGQVEAEALPPISEGQCGTQSPLSVTGVLTNGRMVPLSSPATLTCGMATALPGWMSAVDNYLRAKDNTEIESLITSTSYMCRNVNNAASGNLSDHAFADALDVMGFRLKDGRTVTILEGWPGTPEQGSSLVRYAHDAACSSFTTVLGPEANAQHRDHLHLDLLCHGRSCTARLCE